PSRGLRILIQAGLLLGVAPAALLRADITGSILRTVHDASGAAMPSASVAVTNVKTNQTLQTVTDASGEYRFLAVPVGTYKVEASQPGFRKFVADNVELTVNQERRVDIMMDVGSLEQQVEITAAAVQVET